MYSNNGENKIINSLCKSIKNNAKLEMNKKKKFKNLEITASLDLEAITTSSN
jgi:hypothetical protein